MLTCKNPLCKKEFLPSRCKSQKYCSDKCAKFMHKHGRDILKYIDKPCENCGKQHNHTYGSGRFCSEECKVEYITNKNKTSDHTKVTQHLDKLRKCGKISKTSPYGTWKCNICGDILRTRRELKSHIKSIHEHQTNDMNTNSNICPYCSMVFTHKNQLPGHLSNCPKHPNKTYHIEAHKRAGITFSNRVKTGDIKRSNLSHNHTIDTKEKLSSIRSQQVKNEYLNNFHAKVKWYKVRNIEGVEFSVCGRWEENVALQLNKLGILWVKSEPLKYFKDYWHNYTPDFYIPDRDVYIEVKGRYPDTDREKMRLVTEQHPDKKIYFIHKKYKDFISGKCQFDDSLLITKADL